MENSGMAIFLLCRRHPHEVLTDTCVTVKVKVMFIYRAPYKQPGETKVLHIE